MNWVILFLQVGGQAVLGRQHLKPTPWLTERHGYDPTSNDYLFELFKKEEITFNQIIPTIENTINTFIKHKIRKVEDVYLLNTLSRE